MAPLLLIGAGLTVVFRANIWNLGYNGQFLLAAAVVTGYGPSLTNHLPLWFAMLLLFLMAGLTGAVWTIVPAVLKARYGTNEIITTLMMSFIGVDLASLLIKGRSRIRGDIPQTRVRLRQDASADPGHPDPHRAAGRVRRDLRRVFP
jgi:simple sugar transport system permease protein